jgi:hypothetical protein
MANNTTKKKGAGGKAAQKDQPDLMETNTKKKRRRASTTPPIAPSHPKPKKHKTTPATKTPVPSAAAAPTAAAASIGSPAETQVVDPDAPSTESPTNGNPSTPGEQGDRVLTNQEIANTMNPGSENVRRVSPEVLSRNLHKMVVDTNADPGYYKSVLKNTVQGRLWSVCKFPDYDSKQGKMLKHFIRSKLNMTEQNFENSWSSKTGIKKDVTDILRNHRAYVVQQFKAEYFGKHFFAARGLCVRAVTNHFCVLLKFISKDLKSQLPRKPIKMQPPQTIKAALKR